MRDEDTKEAIIIAEFNTNAKAGAEIIINIQYSTLNAQVKYISEPRFLSDLSDSIDFIFKKL